MISETTIYAFIDWCDATLVSQTIQQSLWLFPVIESVHLLGLALLGGAALVLDARLLNVGLTQQPLRIVAVSTWRWFFRGILLMLVTGVALFMAESEKLYNSDSFWLKMGMLAFILLFTLTLKRRYVFHELAGAGPAELKTPLYGQALGAISLSAWFVVAAAGRWIGFS